MKQITTTVDAKKAFSADDKSLDLLESIFKKKLHDFFTDCKSAKTDMRKPHARASNHVTFKWMGASSQSIVLDIEVTDAISEVFSIISKQRIELLNKQLEQPNLTKQQKAEIMNEIFDLENEQIQLKDSLQKAKGELQNEDFSNLGKKFQSSAF